MRRAGNDAVDFRPCLGQAVLMLQRAGDAGPRPGELSGIENGAVGGFGGLGIALGEHHLGALAQDLKTVGAGRLAVALGFEDGERPREFLAALLAVVLGEELLLGEDALQPQQQPVRREGLDDVVVRHQFDGGNDLFVGLLAGHHHEHGFVCQQAEAAELLQQLLAGAAVAEHIVAENDVRGVVADAVERVLIVGGEFDGKGADGLGDGAQGVAGRRLVVDDQEALAGETVVHGRRRVKRAPPSALSLVSVRLPCRPWRTCISASEAASSRPVPLLGGICG